jgi:hypothetical protein
MKFKTLAIEGFRSHTKTLLEFERITAIRGENAVGKTTIEDAFGFLLAGRTMSTGANGQGADKLINKDSDKAVITAELEDGVKMRASLTEKGGRSFQVKNGALKELPRDVWSCLCSTRYFARMRPEEQRGLLSTLVVPPDAEMPAAALEVLGPAFKPSDSVLWDIEQGYSIAFEQRTDVGRRIRDWREPEKPSDQEIDVEGVREQIRVRQGELDQARERRAAMLGGVEELKALRQAIEKNEEMQREKLDDAKSEHARASTDLLSAETMERLKGLAAKKPEYTRLSKLLIQQIAEANLAVTAVEKAGEIEKHAGKCPTCGQAVTEEVLTAIYQPLIDANGRAQRARDETQAKLRELDVADGEFRDAEFKLERHNEAKVKIKRLDAKIEAAEYELEKLAGQRKELDGEDSAIPAAVDTTEVDALIADLERRIERGWTIHTDASRAQQRRADYEAAWATRKELDVEKARLDRACEVLGPKGVRVQMLEKYVREFAGNMNGILMTWGYTIDLSLEPYTFRLERSGPHAGKWQIDLDMLSESEKLRFGIGFQIALAIHLGVGFVVIDQMDMLDLASRRALFNWLLSDERIEQAVLLVTDEKLEAPAAPGTVFYRLEIEEGATKASELRRTAA